MHTDNISWLTTVPATDGNFKCHLRRATTKEIQDALIIMTESGEKGNATKIAALSRELRKRERQK